MCISLSKLFLYCNTKSIDFSLHIRWWATLVQLLRTLRRQAAVDLLGELLGQFRVDQVLDRPGRVAVGEVNQKDAANLLKTTEKTEYGFILL